MNQPRLVTFANAPAPRARWRRCALAVALLGTLFAGCAPHAAPHEPPPTASAANASNASEASPLRAIRVHFTCVKILDGFATPLKSSGEFMAERGGSVRLSVRQPYTSDFIWHGGKTLARSQHEGEWTIANQPSRPGLTGVLAQIGQWSLAGAAIPDGFGMYRVTRQDHAAPVPDVPVADDLASFVLTPTNADLAKSVKAITLTVHEKKHQLARVEIITVQDDKTDYSFSDAVANPTLPADTFTPRR